MGSTKIYVQQDLSGAEDLFAAGQSHYDVRLTVSEMQDMQCMISICMLSATERTELFILNEMLDTIAHRYDTLLRKGVTNKHKAGFTFKFQKSAAYTLFCWMNQYQFEHPLYTTLSYHIVNQIYKQLL